MRANGKTMQRDSPTGTSRRLHQGTYGQVRVGSQTEVAGTNTQPVISRVPGGGMDSGAIGVREAHRLAAVGTAAGWSGRAGPACPAQSNTPEEAAVRQGRKFACLKEGLHHGL